MPSCCDPSAVCQLSGAAKRACGLDVLWRSCQQQSRAEPRPLHRCPTLPAVLPQRLLVSWRAALAGATRAVDYAGAMLNYCVVGAAVFAGEGQDRSATGCGGGDV